MSLVERKGYTYEEKSKYLLMKNVPVNLMKIVFSKIYLENF